ncbi:DJ-1/PfpI family protein [Pseudoxanthomonas wuyuanensis]|uniref:DJ-1/PfpI family protein n=1 Tax=Pseudoxanthomonas wuyuanensis TaxID=1073196 RepID=A0A286DFW0_9GAMM|nr:DJ-1/PfpI family protein [Pseudoxanthomonas wuyuanensis]SOD57538.1 DJ-1/PfpI family protein [Pseudoxanthomonas wuyuanensis]
MAIHRFIRPLALLLPWLAAAPVQAAHAPHSQPEIQVGILLFDGVQIVDFAAPYEVFGQAGFGVSTVSAHGKAVTTAMGLKVTPDASFADAPQFDVLLVPGGDVGHAERDPVLLDFVRTRSGQARQVLTVCTGASILAATGLLDGLKATTFHNALKPMAAAYPKVTVVDDVRWADNGKIVTSAGLSSGIDAALHIVAKLRDEEAARAVALHLEYDWDPEGGFVRARMADRHLPELRNVAWPQDMKLQRLISVGDAESWRKRYRIATATPPDALLALMHDDLVEEGWQPDAAAGGHGWQKRIDGRMGRLTFATRPASDGAGYTLEAEIRIE